MTLVKSSAVGEHTYWCSQLETKKNLYCLSRLGLSSNKFDKSERRRKNYLIAKCLFAPRKIRSEKFKVKVNDEQYSLIIVVFLVCYCKTV